MELNKIILSKKKEYWFPIIGSSLIHWSLGFAYTLGNIIPYIASYMSLKGRYYVGVGKLCWIEGIFVLFQGGSNYLFPSITEILDHYICLKVGIVFCCLGLILSYLFLDNFILYIISYSVIYGIGHGVLYSSTISLVSNFYKEELKSNMIGILWFFRGISMAVLPSIQSSFVNPKDIHQNYRLFDDYLFASVPIIEKIPKLIQLMFVFSFVSQSIGFLILAKGMNKDQNLKENKDLKISFSIPKKTINSESFKLLWLITFLTWPCIEYIQIYWKIHGIINTKLRDQQLSTISCIALTLHIFGRIFWGIFAEIAGYLNCICILSTILVSGIILLMFPILEITSIFQYILGYMLISVAHSGTSVIFPSIIVKNFGSTKFLAIFFLLFIAKVFSCILFCIITEFTTKYLNIQYSLIPLLIFSLGSFFLSFILKDNGTNIKPIQEVV